MRRPELWTGRPSLLRRSGVRASQVAPLRTTFAAFLHGATCRSVGLSACRNAASRSTPQVGAPFMTPAVRQDETSSGTGATTGVLDREAVFVTPFRRAGVTSGAPTYHVCSFSAWCDIRPFGLSACRNAVSRNTPQVGAPFMTPAIRQDETSDRTDATARALGRATVFVTPFRRAGVTSGAPTYHVCSFSAWYDMQAYQAFGLLQRRFP